MQAIAWAAEHRSYSSQVSACGECGEKFDRSFAVDGPDGQSYEVSTAISHHIEEHDFRPEEGLKVGLIEGTVRRPEVEPDQRLEPSSTWKNLKAGDRAAWSLTVETLAKTLRCEASALALMTELSFAESARSVTWVEPRLPTYLLRMTIRGSDHLAEVEWAPTEAAIRRSVGQLMASDAGRYLASVVG